MLASDICRTSYVGHMECLANGQMGEPEKWTSTLQKKQPETMRIA